LYDLKDSFIDDANLKDAYASEESSPDYVPKSKSYDDDEDDPGLHSDDLDVIQEGKRSMRVNDNRLKRKYGEEDDTRPVCQYKEQCYRKNADHRKQFWHPPKGEPPTKKQKNSQSSDEDSGEIFANEKLVEELIQMFGSGKKDAIVAALIETKNDSTKAAQILKDT